MRQSRMAILLGSATLILTGCSAGRTITNPFASGNASVQSSGTSAYSDSQYANEYESDPVGPPSRIAIEPNPVPPARGISLTKQISLTTTTVGRRKRVDECTPNPTCVAPAHCAPQNQSLISKGRGLFGKLCPFPSRQPRVAACAPQQACTAEPSCSTPQNVRFVEPSCSIPQATCCIPQSVCVPNARCVPEYAQPLVTGNAVEGCDTNNRRGLFGRMLSCLTGPRREASPGAYCPPACSTPAHYGCATEGCGTFSATPVEMPTVGRNPTDSTPLVDTADDPFSQPAVSAEKNTKPPVPDTPAANLRQPLNSPPPVGKPLQADDIPDATQPTAVPLQPSGGEPQTWIEPRPWNRLQTPSSAGLVVQPRGYMSQPISWPQQ